MPIKIAVRAHEIATLLDRAPQDIQVLSLDCFDTLLWRNAQAPSDVFTEFGYEGGSIEPRVLAEKGARGIQDFETGAREVTIEAICRELLPKPSDDAAIAAAVQREIDAEAKHCFGFKPVVALIEAAKVRGLKIIIVSDTYFSPEQLRGLIARSAGEDVADAIDTVFTSSQFGLSKVEGLFEPVLKALGIPASKILHVGDNPHADQTAADAAGLNNVHFEQFDEATHTRLRLEAAAATIIDPAVRVTMPVTQPHRPLLSLRKDDDAAGAFGHDVIGPLMHSFVAWVQAEIEALSAQHGKPVKPLFVMRDGYLPMKMFETLQSGIEARPVSISRIAAGRSGFVDAEAVRTYVMREGPRHRFDVLAGLMLLERNEASKLVRGSEDGRALAQAIVQPETSAKIVRRSARYADRLIAHLRRAGVEDGDVVMLVDLGYNGTVQNLIDPVLKARMNVTSVGRYLLLRETPVSGLDKKGLFDKSSYDLDTLSAIGSSIAIIEQICTVAQGSVVDYHANGKPILASSREKGQQSRTRDRIQEAAIGYGDAIHAYGATGAKSDDADARRRMSAAILARLMYFPTADEVALFESFDHDVNLGTSSTLKMLDTEGAAASMRQHGLPYAQRAQRMFLPAELQSQGLPLNLSLFGIVRFGLDLREGDFHVGAIEVPVIMLNARDQALINCPAYPTHDGYYTLSIPARADLTLAVQIGMVCEVAQIDQLCFRDAEAPAETFMGSNPTYPATSMPDGMEPIAADLYKCSEAGLLIVPPPAVSGVDTLTLNLTFRPVVRRPQAMALQKAA